MGEGKNQCTMEEAATYNNNRKENAENLERLTKTMENLTKQNV